MTAWDRTLYVLAEKLGMTVHRLKTEMPLPELLGWVAFLNDSGETKAEPIDLTAMSTTQLGAMFS